MQITNLERPPDEEVRVLFWRFEQLLEAGYSQEQAVDLSVEPTVDLHQAISLLRRGCPPAVALAILH